MKSTATVLVSVLLTGLVAASPAAAQTRLVAPPTTAAAESEAYTPFMLSFVTPLQVPPRDFDVGGLRISLIFGECRNFDGLDIGVVGRTTGAANGLQLGAIANIVQGDGLGFQAGTVNAVKGEYTGLQIGVANYAEKATAFQIGVYNGAKHIEGCQIGLINTTRTMAGIQIGLINVIQDNDAPFIPVINGYF